MERSEDIAATARFFNRAISAFGSDGPVNKTQVLDFGCGSGLLVERLLDLGYDAYGCDIDLGYPTPERCSLIGRSPYRLPFDNDRFDIVLSTTVLEHARNPNEYLAEIRRVLKPGGTAMHLFPGKWYLPREPHILIPLANYFYPNCPTWWFALWAMLGVCHPDHRREGWRKTVEECRDFYDNRVIYLSSRQHERLAHTVFGNYEWPMEFYIVNGHGTFANVCRRLPMRRLWGLISREFRMAFLVQRKQPTDSGYSAGVHCRSC
jgi:SAM-dependent methyltransferase